MTGFGRAHGPLGRDWTAEIVVRSVNHRFLDLTVKARETEASLEPVVRRALAKHVSRGKVEVALRVRRLSAAGHAVMVDEALLEALLARFAALSEKSMPSRRRRRPRSKGWPKKRPEASSPCGRPKAR